MPTEPVAQRRRPSPALVDPTIRRFLLFGFAVWFVATAAFRLVGQSLLDPSAPVVVGALFVAAVPTMIALALLLYRWNAVTGAARLRAAVALALPGLVLDTVSTVWFETVFPNMVPAAVGYFGGLLLLAYASVLLSGFVPSRREDRAGVDPVGDGRPNEPPAPSRERE